MKKLMLMFVMLFGMSIVANAQEWFITGTKSGSSTDSYVSGGFMKKGWGFYVGLPYGEVKSQTNGAITAPGINTATGTLSSNMKFGLLRQVKEDKAVLGFGIQPTPAGNKPNLTIMYNPLRPGSVLNLWTIGNIVGGDFTLGLGLSYKVGKK